MAHSLVWVENNPIVTFEGNLDFEGINDANNAIIGDARFDRMKFQLFDHTRVTWMYLTERESKLISILDTNSSIWNQYVKVALVFSNESYIQYVQAYVQAMKLSKWDVRVFLSYQEAYDWCIG